MKFVALLMFVLLQPGLARSQNAEITVPAPSAGGAEIWVDMNPAGNTATSVASIQRCRTVDAANAIFDIDVVVFNAPDFQKINITLAFDSAYVQVLDADPQYLHFSRGGIECYWNVPWWIEQGNRLRIYSWVTGDHGGSGTGVLARITFQGKVPFGQSGFDVIESTFLDDGSGTDCHLMNWGDPLVVDFSQGIGQAYIDPTGTVGCWTVTSTGDVADGAVGNGICDVNPAPGIVECTLRAAIQESNAKAGTNRVSFRIPDESRACGPPCTIPCPDLPALSDASGATTIDGSTHPAIVLDGSGGATDVLRITSGNNVIRNVTIQGGAASGIGVYAADGNRILGCRIGTDHTGTVAASNAGNGIEIVNGANNEIGGITATPGVLPGNIISGNLGDGIHISAGATGNQIQGNLIGLGSNGIELGNTLDGIYISDSPDNDIGGTTENSRNVISGNEDHGVYLLNASGTEVRFNYVGTSVDGMAARGNGLDGMRVDGPAGLAAQTGPLQVGATIADGLLSGNLAGNGITFAAGAHNNTVLRNAIGTTLDRTAALPNAGAGVSIIAGAHDNIIGSIGDGNVISGNVGSGVDLSGADTDGNLVRSNLIGLDGTGSFAIPNARGVEIHLGAQFNEIGGSLSGQGNVISGNTESGVHIVDADTDNNRVELNIIGADMNRKMAIANSASGVFIQNGAELNTVVDNYIEGNTPHGVHVLGDGVLGNASRNEILDNFIGSVSLPNTVDGVHLGPRADLNKVTLNTIGNNSGDGIDIEGLGSDGNLITGNSVLGNGASGVRIRSDANDNVIGGFIAPARNLIQGNSLDGVTIVSGVRNGLHENSILLNGGLGIDLGSDGVTPNDPVPDGDAGANDLQNCPVLASAIQTGGVTTVVGTLTSLANTDFRIEFFTNTACDPSGSGEGATFLGAAVVTTNASGTAAINQTFGGVLSGTAITATATDTLLGNTSEFSACVVVPVLPGSPTDLAIQAGSVVLSSAPGFFVESTFDTTLLGDTLTYHLIASNEGPGGATGVAVLDTLPEGVTFISSVSSQGACTGTEVVSCDVGAMAVDDTVTITITVFPYIPGILVNVAEIQGNEVDPDSANNVSRDTTVVVPPPPPPIGFDTRDDAIWARRTTENIVLNGILSETSWAKAESLTVRFGADNGIPGSGWRIEAGVLPNDSTYATLKLLVRDNQMFLGAEVRDRSTGGSASFNRFDGFLMAIKDHLNALDPKPPAEYFYSWWNPEVPDPQPPGQMPNFVGRWGSSPIGSPRDSTAIANWDAVTVVNGTSNTDATNDVGYTVEMRFNLTPMGYDVTRPEGDIVEWNIDIFDCDWYWPNTGQFSSTRAWWQSPWGNAAWYNEVRVYARPAVTVNSGPLPIIHPDFIVGDGSAYEAPTVNGALTEPVWAQAPSVRIRYGDSGLRQSYPGVGRYRSGQYQPTVNGGLAAVVDPGDATVKTFVRGNKLYMGFDVSDQFVQYHSAMDRWDGFIVSMNDRTLRGSENELVGRRLSFHVNESGGATAADYLSTLVFQAGAQVAISLKAGTTVDTVGTDIDAGYTAELMLDLTQMGYPNDLGDRLAFLGVNLLDGDSFGDSYTDSYGTRTWWYREYEYVCCPAWALLSLATVSGVGQIAPKRPGDYVLLGSYPNPSVLQTIRYSLAERSKVTLRVFDIGGRLVETRDLGVQPSGTGEFRYDARPLSAGLYLYQLKIVDPETGALRAALSGRMIVSR